jgi:AcrR family transcriptional regulator
MGGKGGEVAVKSVRTPWGNSGELRSQIRRMGRASVPEETERKQIERLFAAMVALSSAHGYEETTVDAISKLAGVSKGSFYEHFANKEELLLAAVEALVEPTLKVIEEAEEPTEKPGAPGRGSLPRADCRPIGRLTDGRHRGLCGWPRGERPRTITCPPSKRSANSPPGPRPAQDQPNPNRSQPRPVRAFSSGVER